MADPTALEVGRALLDAQPVPPPGPVPPASVCRAAREIADAMCAPVDRPASSEQPAPIPNDRPAVWDLVLADMAQRDQVGRRRYGTPLQPFNGRDGLRDMYEELLDAAVYARQLLFERDGR